MSQRDTKDTLRPMAYRVKDAVNVIGLGKSTLYEMMSAGTLRFVKVGNRRLIPADALRPLSGLMPSCGRWRDARSVLPPSNGCNSLVRLLVYIGCA